MGMSHNLHLYQAAALFWCRANGTPAHAKQSTIPAPSLSLPQHIVYFAPLSLSTHSLSFFQSLTLPVFVSAIFCRSLVGLKMEHLETY
jgi:hypothetical protein